MKINRESERGIANFSWLKAKHSFSFGQYFNPYKMNYNSLRVINEDLIEPNSGFPTHSHDNMEILTFVIKGKLAHKDSLGNIEYLENDKIQRMYAGSGISHSEYNASDKEPLNLLQIWIEPNVVNLDPDYNEKDLDYSLKEQLLVSPTGRDNSIKIYQDVEVFLINLKEGDKIELNPKKDSYTHIVNGSIITNDDNAFYGDSIESTSKLSVLAKEDSKLLFFNFLK